VTDDTTPDGRGSSRLRSVVRDVIPVVEEQAVVLKRRALTDGLRVSKVVREREEVVDEPLATEAIEVERVALDRFVDGPVPVREEGATTIVTLVEEVVVVEKRLRAVEELRITRRRSVRRAPERVTLRREEAVVERLRVGGAPDDSSGADPDAPREFPGRDE
jgi:stress response protein YsnF